MSVSLVNGNYDVSYISQIMNLDTTGSASGKSGSFSTNDSDSDTVSISASGSASSQLISLVQQRQSITQSRADLVETATDSEGGADSIADQLESYDSQLEAINAEIAQARAQAVQEQAQSVVTYSKNTIRNGNSAQTNHLSSIVNLSANLSAGRAAASSMNRLDRDENSLKGEIDADESRGFDTSGKKEALSALEDKATNAATAIADSLNGINQAIIEYNGNPLIELDYTTTSFSSTGDETDGTDDEETATA